MKPAKLPYCGGRSSMPTGMVTQTTHSHRGVFRCLSSHLSGKHQTANGCGQQEPGLTRRRRFAPLRLMEPTITRPAAWHSADARRSRESPFLRVASLRSARPPGRIFWGWFPTWTISGLTTRQRWKLRVTSRLRDCYELYSIPNILPDGPAACWRPCPGDYLFVTVERAAFSRRKRPVLLPRRRY